MTKFITGAAIGALITFLIVDADAADLDTQFNQIGFGAKPEQAIELLGKPDSEIAWNTLSFQHRRWKWTAGGRSYVLVFAFDHVISKKGCTGLSVDC